MVAQNFHIAELFPMSNFPFEITVRSFLTSISVPQTRQRSSCADMTLTPNLARNSLDTPLKTPSKSSREPSYNTLFVSQIKESLRARGIPFSPKSKKAVLIRLLVDNDAQKPMMDAPVKTVSFDRKGRDPATLIGLRVNGFYHYDNCNLFLFTEAEVIRINVSEHAPTAFSFVKLDAILRDALWENLPGEFPSWVDDVRPQTTPESKKKRGSMAIIEAAVGIRDSEGAEHRVIGIRFEGMERMGYVYCEEYEKLATMTDSVVVDATIDKKGSAVKFRDVTLAEDVDEITATRVREIAWEAGCL